MPLFRVNVLGRDLHDRLVAKLIIGGICMLIILFTTGFDATADWVVNALIIWTGATFFFVPLAYGIVTATFTLKYLFIMIIGVILLVLYGIFGELSPVDLTVSVIKSIVWMALFSLILDEIKDKVDF